MFKVILVLLSIVVIIGALIIQPWRTEIFYTYNMSYSAEAHRDSHGREGIDRQSIEITNPGFISLLYSISTSEPWLIIEKSEGRLKRKKSELIEVAATCEQLEVSIYTATIKIKSSNAKFADKEISVKLNCYPSPPRPKISFEPEYMKFSVPAGKPSQNQKLTITNSGDSNLDYKLLIPNETEGWLNIGKKNLEGRIEAGDNSKINVFTTCEKLKVGEYTEEIKIVSERAINPQDQIVRIILTCEAPPIPMPPNPRHIIQLSNYLEKTFEDSLDLEDLENTLRKYEGSLVGTLKSIKYNPSEKSRLEGEKRELIKKLYTAIRKWEQEKQRLEKAVSYYNNKEYQIEEFKGSYEDYKARVEIYNGLVSEDSHINIESPIEALNSLNEHLNSVKRDLKGIEALQCLVESVKFLIDHSEYRIIQDDSCSPEQLLDGYLSEFLAAIAPKYNCVGIQSIRKDEGGNKFLDTKFGNHVRDLLMAKPIYKKLQCDDSKYWVVGNYRIINSYKLELSLKLLPVSSDNIIQPIDPFPFIGKCANPDWDQELDIAKCR